MKLILGLMSLITSLIAIGSETIHYCSDSRLADAPEWQVIFSEERLTILPTKGHAFPKEIQTSEEKIVLEVKNEGPLKQAPLGWYVGKNDKGATVSFLLHSIDVESFNSEDTNFYRGSINSDAKSVDLVCWGPKMNKKVKL